MKRTRLISGIVAVISIIGALLTNTVFAAGSANLAVNPGFDKDTSGWTARYGATVTWDENGHSGGCAKVKLNAGYSSIAQTVSFKPGRTYDISFYIRLEEGSSTVMVIQNYSSGEGGWTYLISNEPINENWKKVMLTYTCTGYNSKGGEVEGDGVMEFRIGDGQTKLTHYIDELVITQRPSEDDDEEAVNTPEPTVAPTPMIDRGVREKNFADMQGHWAESIVKVLASDGFVNGIDNEHFSPETKLTRVQFIKLIVSAFRLENEGYKNAYSDVSSDAWYAEDVQTAKDIGLISRSLTMDGNLRPDEPITREDAAVIIANAASIKKLKGAKKTPLSYSDINSASEYATRPIDEVTQLGLVSGFGDGTFRPGENMTRAQGATMFLNFVNRLSRIAIFVDPENGNDSNDGSFAAPLSTVAGAKALVAKSNKNMTGNMYVLMKGGEYFADQTLEFGPEDSGSNGYNIVYTSYNGTARISGGIHITGFSLYDSANKIYRAKVDKNVNSRQLFVNGVRAVRARSKSGLNNCTTDNGTVGHTTTDAFLADYKHVSDLEMVYYEQWTNPRCGVSSIEVNDGVATLVMDQPGWNAVRNKGGTSVTSPVYYENAIELLDEPGEWYLDNHEGWLYYMPRSFEDVLTADVVLPVTEKLIYMTGSEDENVHNIYFDKVEFAYTTWMRPSTENGHSDAQNNHIRQTGVAAMPDSAVRVTNGRYINFTNCTFDKLGITALQMFGSIKNCNVCGNEFRDISGSAISLGTPDTGDANVWNPKEEKYIIRNNKIKNNFIHSIAVDYKSAAAISAGFPKDTEIAHNEIFDAPYSGMHIGYGWDTKETTALENVRVEQNYIHSVMSDRIYDGGGIYLMGATAGTMENPNLVAENYIESIKNYYGALYPDEGTQFWKITRNVIDLSDTPYWYGNGNNKGQSKWLHCWASTIRNMQYVDNYSTVENRTYNGTNSIFEEAHVYPDANWPKEAQQIMDNAGLEMQYLERFADGGVEVSMEQTEYNVKSGESFKLKVNAKGRKRQAAELDMNNVYFRSRDESIASVAPDGTVTPIRQGQTTIVCDVLLKDIIKTFEISITVDDVLDSVKLNTKRIQIEAGYDYEIKATAYSKFGKKLDVDSIRLESSDTSVAATDGMLVKGVGSGEAEVVVRVTNDGTVTEQRVPVKVLAAGEQAEQVEYDFSDELMHPEDWTMDNNVVKSKITNGMLVSTPNTFIAYAGSEFKDELFRFDLKINAESGWPSVCLRASDTTSPYSSADLYMITFGNGKLELQRFNSGARTVIYGSQTGYESLGGEAIPCGFEYNKKYTVKCGAKNEDGGVRITVYINNVKVMDYLDTDEKAIKNQGYFELYCRSGNMEITAPTR